LAVAHVDGRLYVADTYNNKIKVIDLEGPACASLVGNGQPGLADDPPQFDEPAGLAYAAGRLYVADTNNHAIRVVHLEDGNRVTTLEIAGLEPPPAPEPTAPAEEDLGRQIALEPQTVQAQDGAVRLAVKLTLPEGYKINPLAPMNYRLAADGDGPVDRGALGVKRLETPAAEFVAALPVTAADGDDTVRLSLTYYYCQEGGEGLCKVGRATWTVPLRLTDDGPAEVPLELKVE
jgi:hypothetical protein